MDKEALSAIIQDTIKEIMGKEVTPAQENIARWLTPSPSITRKRFIEHSAPPKTFGIQKHTSQGDFSKVTPARIGVGRAGTRYLTKVALKFRADHAVAKDAVYAELADDFASKNGWTALSTQAKDKQEYLLRPDLGRVLSDDSLKIVQQQGIKNPDIQIIVADGLSPWAAERNAKPLIDEMIKLFNQDGYSIGTVFCVKYSRIAVQDVIGETVGAKLSMIILGERPGLGGGDSLSNYMIYGPKVGAVNAAKSMISNIHPAGHTPLDAAKLTVHMVKQMFAQKCSGIELKI